MSILRRAAQRFNDISLTIEDYLQIVLQLCPLLFLLSLFLHVLIFEPTDLARPFRDTTLLQEGSIGREGPQQSLAMSVMEFVSAGSQESPLSYSSGTLHRCVNPEQRNFQSKNSVSNTLRQRIKQLWFLDLETGTADG